MNRRRGKGKGGLINPESSEKDEISKFERKLKLLGLIVARLEVEDIVQIISLQLNNSEQPVLKRNKMKDTQVEEQESSIELLLGGILEMPDSAILDAAVLDFLQITLGKHRKISTHFSKTNLELAAFAFHILYQLVFSRNLISQNKHDVLLNLVVIFSSILPPSTFDLELELYQIFNGVSKTSTKGSLSSQTLNSSNRRSLRRRRSPVSSSAAWPRWTASFP